METFYLDHFLVAHEAMLEVALRELQDGKKQSHWMWFIFPQCVGLGRSDTAEYYAIESLDEARAYLAHQTLGDNFRRCLSAALLHSSKRPEDIFGKIDAKKFKSCLTLFKHAANMQNDKHQIADALHVFFNNQECPRTLEFLSTVNSN